MAIVDEVSPASYGQNLIGLTLAPGSDRLRALFAVVIQVDYSAALPSGIVLPLEFTVVSDGGAATYQRQIFRRLAPSLLSFVPREGGPHLVRLAELHHNRWFGSLALDVEGELLRSAFNG